MRKTGRRQRGAVALEFALVFPVLLTLLGMMTAVGLGLKARHQMLNYASSAARYCAFQKLPSTTQINGADGCAKSYVNYISAQDPPGNVPACVDAIQTSATAKPSSITNMYYLTVQTSCTASWVPIIGPIAGVTWPGTTYQVIATSSMPFMGPQPLLAGPPPP